MQPDALLALANEMPSKFGVESYRDTISALRRKRYSWREIADFLIEKGVKTDHARIYRMMMLDDPLYDFDDASLNIGGQLFESQKGLPLKPYNLGMYIRVKSKLTCIQLEHPEKVDSTWCQCQFRLSARPNRIWLKKLHDMLHAEFRPEWPHHLVCVTGYELKFEGDVLALDSQTFNLEQHFQEVRDGILRTTEYFRNDKTQFPAILKSNEARNRKILDLYSSSNGEGDSDHLQAHTEDYSDKTERLKKQFENLELH